MKKIILFTLSIIFTSTSFAQLEAEWFTEYGDNNTDLARNIAIDKNGNTYVIGYVTRNFGDLTKPKLLSMTFLLKFDVKGELKWSKEIYGENSNDGNAVAVDSNGNVYMAGVFTNTIRLDGVTMIQDSKDLNTYIVKYDTDGKHVWHKILRPQQQQSSDDHHHHNHEKGEKHSHFHPIANHITDMKIDKENNFYITGYFSKSIDFDPSEKEYLMTADTALDAFIAKYNAQGDFIWGKTLKGDGVNKSNSLTIDSENNVYFTGTFNKKAHLGELNVQDYGGNGIVIGKLNKNGKELWLKQITNTKNNSGNCIYADKNDNLFLVGNIGSRTEFVELDKVLEVNENAANLLMAKLNTKGEYQWVRSVKTKNYSVGESILTDSYNNVYVSGYFAGSIESAEKEMVFSSGREDGFIMMLDEDANIIYTYPLGGTDHDRATKMVIHKDNSLVIIGNHKGPFYINPTIFADFVEFRGTTDAFIIKFSHTLEKPNLKIQEVTSQSIALSWNVQAYAIGYEIILIQGKQNTPYYIGNNSVTLTSLLPATSYTLRARAYNDSKHSKQSEVKITTPPVSNEAKGVKSNEFTASWTKNKLKNLKLYVSTHSDFSENLPAYNGITVDKNTLKIQDLQSNTTYYYRLQTDDGNYSNTINVTTK